MRLPALSRYRVVAAGVVGIALLVIASVLASFESRSAEAADPVLVGAGDVAHCSTVTDEATAKLLDGIAGTVFTLGDNAYNSGTAAQFKNCYGPTWGRHKARTMPSAGNHEYYTSGASGYFGASVGDPSKGYYSYDRGD
jgi:hypothetical protein